jgi:hypothetical protein
MTFPTLRTNQSEKHQLKENKPSSAVSQTFMQKCSEIVIKCVYIKCLPEMLQFKAQPLCIRFTSDQSTPVLMRNFNLGQTLAGTSRAGTKSRQHGNQRTYE